MYIKRGGVIQDQIRAHTKTEQNSPVWDRQDELGFDWT